MKIAVGTTVLNVGYPWLTLPLALDYWKADGYDVVGVTLQLYGFIDLRPHNLEIWHAKHLWSPGLFGPTGN